MAHLFIPETDRLYGTLDTKRKKVLAHVFGPRNIETLRRLLQLLKKFSIGRFTIDGWPGYQQQISQHKHLVGKIFTQRIERHNLTLRTHIKRLARRTICFSKSIEIHEKVIGAYIEKFHYQSL
jgi:insertion element IS1 protein InsB